MSDPTLTDALLYRPTLNVALKAIADLDVGLPVEAEGIEYIMIDKPYQRQPVFDANGRLIRHQMLGVDANLGDLMAMFLRMSEEERFALSSRRTLKPRIAHRHSFSVMIDQARAIAHAPALKAPFQLSGKEAVFDPNGDPITGPVQLRLDRPVLTFEPEADVDVVGTSVDRFSIFAAGSTINDHGELIERCDVYLGSADCHQGFLPNQELAGIVNQD